MRLSSMCHVGRIAHDGDTYHGKYRIKKYKVPKITRKRKATTEDDVKVPLAQTPTGLFKNATSS
jgi:hypothetical protein